MEKKLTLSNITKSFTDVIKGKVFAEVVTNILLAVFPKFADMVADKVAERLSVDNAVNEQTATPKKPASNKSTGTRKYYGRRRSTSKKSAQSKKADTPKVYEPITFLYISTEKGDSKKVKEQKGLELRLKEWDKNHDRYVAIRDKAKDMGGEVNAKRFTFKKSEDTRTFYDYVVKAYPDTKSEGVKEF